MPLNSLANCICVSPPRCDTESKTDGTPEPAISEELGRIEELINALSAAADSAVAAQARELVQALLELHGTTLERALEIVHENDLTLVINWRKTLLFPIC